MDYDRLCKDILDVDPNIRYAAVCDDSGELKYGGHREGCLLYTSDAADE